METMSFLSWGKFGYSGILLFKLLLFKSSLQMITYLIKHPDYLSPVFVSCIYASTNEIIRRALWSEIHDISVSSTVASKAWFLIGDFNQVLEPSEHSCPPTFNVDRKTREFQECIADVSLSDLNFVGPTFSWWNSQKENPIGKKLDRILVMTNGTFNSLFHWAFLDPQNFWIMRLCRSSFLLLRLSIVSHSGSIIFCFSTVNSYLWWPGSGFLLM